MLPSLLACFFLRICFMFLFNSFICFMYFVCFCGNKINDLYRFQYVSYIFTSRFYFYYYFCYCHRYQTATAAAVAFFVLVVVVVGIHRVSSTLPFLAVCRTTNTFFLLDWAAATQTPKCTEVGEGGGLCLR